MADILLAAELENEMDAMAEGGDCDEDGVYEDEDGEEVAGEEGRMDRSHLVGKPKRKRELKAGLLRSQIALNPISPFLFLHICVYIFSTFLFLHIKNLFRELLMGKPKRHTFSGLYM